MVTIRFAKEEEIPAVMEFIENNWQKGYIMARDEKIVRFDWMEGQNVNIVLALEDGEIIGMESFIAYGRKHRDVMLNGWKVLKGKYPMLGMEIYDFIIKNADVRSWSGLKFQPETGILHEYMGCWTGQMTQWYRLAKCEKYTLAQVSDPAVPKAAQGNLRLRKFNGFDELVTRFSFEEYYASNPHPLKEDWYVEKRYFKHPTYQYDVYGICDRIGKAIALLVTRLQDHDGAKALRIIDVIGDFSAIYGVMSEIDRLLAEYGAEYADMYEYGLSEQKLQTGGWLKVRNSNNIIPDYFTPFVRKNVEINCLSSEPNMILFRGDSDGDRPNMAVYSSSK